ncbi:MAG: DUF1376 domain-containing protein [Armatimonadia bacterium]
MNYWERHIGDYARDTAHLTMIEHGAYTLLLDRYYATEKPIQADQVHRLARARTRDEKAAVDAVLGEFFVLIDGEWHHNRADREIEKAAGRINAAKENGKKGGRPKKQNETDEKPSGFSLGSVSETQTKALHTPDTKHQTPEVSADADTAPAKPAAIRVPDLVGMGVPENVAAAYLQVRKAKRLGPLTEIALAGIKREAAKACLTLDQALTRCVERGWGGFEADWVNKTASPVRQPATLADHNRAVMQLALERAGHPGGPHD